MKYTTWIVACLFAVAPGASSAQTKLKVAYPTTVGSMAVLWVAKEAKLFEKQGLEVELIYVSGSSKVVQAMLAKEIPISEIAGHADAWVMRNRSLLVASRSPRIKRRLPMLVPVANSIHCPSCHRSSAKASTRWPSGRYSRRLTTLNVTDLPRSSTSSGVVTASSVVQ